MTVLAQIFLWAYVPFVVTLFAFLPARRAVILAYLGAWMFLPQYTIRFQGLPELTKITAPGLGVLLGAAIFDANRIMSFRFRWFDWPVVLLIFSPIPTMLTNQFPTQTNSGLVPWDAVSSIVTYTVRWGMPYFIGRLYFRDLQAMRELAISIFLAGLIYMPLCWFEIKQSPQLHRILYGYHPHDFAQTVRGNTYRPTVFMQTGLMVAAWMAAAFMCGYWLWLRKTARVIKGYRTLVPLVLLGLTVVLCKSIGALSLTVAFLVTLHLCTYLRSAVPLYIMVFLIPVYAAVRITQVWDGQNAVAVVHAVAGEDRADSLNFRFFMEDRITQHTAPQWLFGWGGFDRARPSKYEDSDELAVPDGLWIIQYSEHGLFGLVSLYAMLTLPIILFAANAPRKIWGHPMIAPTTILTFVLLTFVLDTLPNAMLNPAFIMTMGGLNSLCTSAFKRLNIQHGRPADVQAVPVSSRPRPAPRRGPNWRPHLDAPTTESSNP